MKIVGIILIIFGLATFIFQGIRSLQTEKIYDLGPIEISKKVERSNSWQIYTAGGIAVVAGLIMLLVAKRRRPVSK